MAKRRMFSKDVTKTSKFLLMPYDLQALYYALGMAVDDDGYVELVPVMRTMNLGCQSVNQLSTNGYLEIYENGVALLLHHNINNQIRKDRHNDSIYKGVKLNKVKGFWQPNGNQMATNGEHSIDKVSIDKIRKKKTSKKETEVSLPSWLDKNTWLEWVQYQKEKRKKLTPSTIKAQFNDLGKDKNNHIAIIRQSIKNGWTGLHPLKEKNSNKQLGFIEAEEGKYDHLS